MSLSTGPPNFAADFLSRYKAQVCDGIAKNLRNLYLYNIKAHLARGKVKNAASMELQPDESYMRLVESVIKIKEEECDGFRTTIWAAWCDGKNTGLLDTRLGPVFAGMAETYQAINKALMVYPNDIDLTPNANDL